MKLETIKKIQDALEEIKNGSTSIARNLNHACDGIEAMSNLKININNIPTCVANKNAPVSNTNYNAHENNATNNNYKTPDIKKVIRYAHRA